MEVLVAFAALFQPLLEWVLGLWEVLRLDVLQEAGAPLGSRMVFEKGATADS